MELFEGSCLDSPPCAAECSESAIPAIDELIKKQADETERLTIDYLQFELNAFTAETLKWKNDYINALKNQFESSNLSDLNFDWETLIDTNPVPSSQLIITDSREGDEAASEARLALALTQRWVRHVPLRWPRYGLRAPAAQPPYPPCL